MKLAFKYNAPFTLSFGILAAVVMGLFYIGVPIRDFLMTLPPAYAVNWADPFMYIRLFGHAIGHGDWGHYFSNFSFILILGPILEEKYSSSFLAVMCLITALVTGLIHSLLPFSTGLLGASGIVFMMVVLVSFTNIKEGEIPLTFVAVLVVYLGKEIINAFQPDQVSQFAHLIGGITGAVFGFIFTSLKNKSLKA